MTTIDIIFLFIIIIVMIILWFFMYRAKKVLDFRLMLNELSCDYSKKMLGMGYPLLIGWEKYFYKLPSQISQTFSFKPLKMESYFTKEDIKELYNVVGNEESDTKNN